MSLPSYHETEQGSSAHTNAHMDVHKNAHMSTCNATTIFLIAHIKPLQGSPTLEVVLPLCAVAPGPFPAAAAAAAAADAAAAGVAEVAASCCVTMDVSTINLFGTISTCVNV